MFGRVKVSPENDQAVPCPLLFWAVLRVAKVEARTAY